MASRGKPRARNVTGLRGLDPRPAGLPKAVLLITLAAGKTCTITYTFKPAAANARWANLSVVSTGGTVGLALSGQGTVR